MMKGFTLWFTGLSGSGKSTLAELVAAELKRRGLTRLEILDGDVVRTNLSKGLGFSKEDRDINIRRIGFVCHILTRNDAVAIAAAISPYKAIRDENRALIKRFIEIYCECPLDTLVERDTKGLYKKALAGEIKGFTGIDDPYEAPENPEITIHSGKESQDESLQKILRTLELMNYIPPDPEATRIPQEEEAKIKERLAELGYL
ncbi:MAG: adenylyl-sulfate kinase [Candidatus Eisenbacteria sp.]|nr:adenylyl-sulfate kinase [Candidatus Eisenbacteria bacterium]